MSKASHIRTLRGKIKRTKNPEKAARMNGELVRASAATGSKSGGGTHRKANTKMPVSLDIMGVHSIDKACLL